MRNILLFSVLLISILGTAQEKLKEAIITSKQTISTDSPQMQARFDAMGETVSTTYIKGNNSRVEMNSPMTGPMVVITNGDKMKSLTLMDNPMAGKKFTIEDLELTPEMKDNIEVVDGNTTKTILGYECEEKIITMSQNGGEVKMTMFVTNKISPVKTQQTAMLDDQIKGYPLYKVINMKQSGMEMTITTEVTNIEATSVSDEKFELDVPEGYTEQ